MKALIILLLVAIATLLSAKELIAEEGPVVIRNKFLEVRADRKTGEITILAKGKPIVTKGRIEVLEDGKQVAAPVCSGGSTAVDGSSIITFYTPGGVFGGFIVLRDGPFADVLTNIHNGGKQPSVVKTAPFFHGSISVSGAAEDVKILGTGGLAKPGTRIGSYMWLAAANAKSRNGVVAGFVGARRGSGIVFAERAVGELKFASEIDFGNWTFKPGDEPSEFFVIGYFDDVHDGLEAWADRFARNYEIKLPPQPCGYCTWYHAGASNEEAMVRQTEIAAKQLKPYGFNFLQIDDGWQDGVKSNGPRKNFTLVRPDGPYPSGMKQTADMIRSHGLTPGIWFMPFAGTWNDPWFKDHQDWFVKRADGKPYDTAWGGSCMDMTSPDARKYLYDNVHRMAHDWGYRFFKMDGLSTGCGVTPQYVNLAYKDDHMGDAVFHDPSKTNIEVFRSGLKLVREAAGPNVFLLGCCAPQNMRSYGGAFGLVDAMRVGPDNNGRNWRSVLTGPRIASRHYHLNGRIWYNDPDVVYVRDSLTLDQARANASWVNITGQLFMVSDDFSKLSPERLEILKRVMPAHGCAARPVDLLEEEMPRIWHVKDTRGPVRRDVVALFNWDDGKPWDVDYPTGRIGLPKAERYVAYDFWGNRLLKPFTDRLTARLPPSSCLILAVRPAADHPQLIGTSRHVTQGMIGVTGEKWDATTNTLSGTSKLVAGDLYELRIATGKEWKAVSVDSNLAGLKPAISMEDGLVRVRVTVPAKEPSDWHWKVSYKRFLSSSTSRSSISSVCVAKTAIRSRPAAPLPE
jgi:hypothetical protein